MKALIVYDSVYGNTGQIAQAIAEALRPKGEVVMLRAGEATAERLAGSELLFVGSPTRGFRPTPAVTDLLERIPANGLSGAKTAAFDTRLSTAKFGMRLLKLLMKSFAYAASPISDGLARKGGEAAAPPEGFVVETSKGPLKVGELVRAGDWAVRVAAGIK